MICGFMIFHIIVNFTGCSFSIGDLLFEVHRNLTLILFWDVSEADVPAGKWAF